MSNWGSGRHQKDKKRKRKKKQVVSQMQKAREKYFIKSEFSVINWPTLLKKKKVP
jgi:hypothetical protein